MLESKESREFLSTPKSPFRVIDVQKGRVVEVGSDLQPYVALSFCWGPPHHHSGESKDFRLLKKNKENLLQSLVGPDLQIPQTISDAIKVVKELGQRYLWSDRLCIVQDDPEDVKHQITQMERIYGKAILTIVAADGQCADAGLKGVEKPRELNQQVIGTVEQSIQVFLPLHIKQQLLPWDKRAWTFQEKLLSRRLLIFSNGHAVWHCRNGVWREDVNSLDWTSHDVTLPWLKLEPSTHDGIVKLEEDGGSRIFRPPAFQAYADAVSQYSGRSMTKPTDIINAFLGLQHVFESERFLGSAFRYGLPERFLDVALLWQPEGAILRREGGTSVKPPPSWSWAGWKGVKSKDSSASEYGVEGAKVQYQKPFEVCTDDKGSLLMRLGHGQDERIQGTHSWFVVQQKARVRPSVPAKPPIAWGTTTTSTPSIAGSNPSSIGLVRIQPSVTDHSKPSAAPLIETHRLSCLDDRHLVCKTGLTQLRLGSSCRRKQIETRRSGCAFIREELELADNGTERFILDERSDSVGILKIHGNDNYQESERVEAIVLSVAQFFGTEKKVDVLGYPLFNIMIIKRGANGIAERVGLGKIYRYAWDETGAEQTTIILA
ncbi:heterokaryon incompatibility protein-domain-containing protein [Cryomyces antarcticus]